MLFAGALLCSSIAFAQSKQAVIDDMMKEEMEIMGPVKTKDVHAAQQKIVEVVRKLEEEGLINTGGGGEDYVL